MKLHFYSLPGTMLIAALFAAIGLMVSGGTLHAANISWTEVVVDSTDGDSSPGAGLGDAAVSTNGTLVEALNFGALTDLTINGVLFKGNDFSVVPTNLSIAYDSADNLNGGFTGTSTGGVIDSMTTSFSRDSGVSAQSAALTGLSIGQKYEVQFIASFANINRSTTFDDGNGNSIAQKTNSPHSFSTGVFTADAVTQTVNMDTGNAAHTQFLSGYQLRAIPEPASLCLLGFAAGVGLIGCRRLRD